MNYLRQSTAATITLGPFLDATDANTAETGLTISQADVRLSKNGGDFAQKNNTAAATHDEFGFYSCALNATDTNTVGTLTVSVKESGALPYFKDYQVVEEAVYDKLFASSSLGPASQREVLTAVYSPVQSKTLPVIGGLTGVDDLLGGVYPIAGRADCEAKQRAVSATWASLCPVERATTYYFDSDAGNDSNDGLTESTPKQTLSAANTLLAAGDICLRLKGTFRHATSAGLTTADNNTITNWEGYAWPRLTGCRLTIAADSAAWTNAAGDRWTATLANASSLREQGSNLFSWLSRADDATECEATDNSYFIDSGTIHVNLAGDDPNDFAWECNHVDDAGDNASNITVTGSNNRIENVICDHPGLRAFPTVSLNQSYGVKFTGSGEDVNLVRNCVVAGVPRHAIGTTPVSGTRTLVENCRVGGVQESSGTLINAFSTNGGNQMIVTECVGVTGRVPEVGMAARSEVKLVFGHKDTSGVVDFFMSRDCELSPDGQDPIQEYGYVSDAPVTTPGDLSTFRAIHLRGRCHATDGQHTIPARLYNAYVSCDFDTKPANTSYDALENARFSGAAIGCRWRVDLSLTDSTFNGVNSVAPAAFPSSPTLINSHFHWYNAITADAGFLYNRLTSSATTLALSTYCVNNLFTTDALPNEYHLGLGDVGSPSITASNNAIYGFVAGDTTGDRGYSTWLNTLVLTDTVSADSPDIRLLGQGSVSLGSACEVDGNGRPLLNPGASIGPWGELAADLTSSGFGLTPAESASLTTIATATSVTIPASIAGTGTPLYERPMAPNRTRKVYRTAAGGLTFDTIVVRIGDDDAAWCLDFAGDLIQGAGISAAENAIGAPSFSPGSGLAVAETPVRSADRGRGVILKFDPTTAGSYTMTMSVTYGDSQGTHTVQGPVTVVAGAS